MRSNTAHAVGVFGSTTSTARRAPGKPLVSVLRVLSCVSGKGL